MGDFSNLVTVQCPNHHDALVSGLWNFLTSRHGLDFDLSWAGQSTRAHRLILEVFLSAEKLATASSLQEFEPPVCGDMAPKSVEEEIEVRTEPGSYAMLQHVPGQQGVMITTATNSQSGGNLGNLSSLLEFLYNGKVTVTEDSLDSLLQVAKEFDFQLLVEAVERSQKCDVRRSTRRQRKVNPVIERPASSEDNHQNSSSDGEPEVETPSTLKRPVRVTRSLTRQKQKAESEAEEDDDEEVSSEEEKEWKERLSDEESSGESVNDEGKDDSNDDVTFDDQSAKLDEQATTTKSRRGRPPKSTLRPGRGRKRYNSSHKAGIGEHVHKDKVDRRKLWRLKQPTLKCEHCPYKSRDGTCYRVHMAKHDPSIVIHRCASCSKAFLTDDSLQRHKCRKVGPPKLYVCPHCDWRTQNVTVYQVHLAKHDPTITVFNCSTCGQAFLSRESLDRHEQNHPLPPKVYDCPHCPHKSRSKINLQVHQAKHDSSIRVLKCGTCSRGFITAEQLERHMVSHMVPPKTHRCQHCDFATSVNRAFYRHLVTVHKVNSKGEPWEEKHKCQLCEFVCNQKHQLRNHMAEKHAMEKPYKCDQCSYASVRRVDLTLHVKFVHKKVRPFMCHLCGHGSVSQNRLNRHLRCHTGEKPFACSECDRRYADRHHFNEHLRKHISDEKPFICHVCPYSCNRRDNLKVHLRKMHSVPLAPSDVDVRKKEHQIQETMQQQRELQQSILNVDCSMEVL